MASRKPDPSEAIARIVFALAIFGGATLWTKTHDAPISIIRAAAVVISIVGFAFLSAKSRHGRLLARGIDLVDTMSGEEFESFLKAHFGNLGYRVETTAVTGDYGADLIATRDKIKYVIQAKRWKRPVGIEAVQQIIGAIKHYGATDAIVVTNSRFTDAARNLAQTDGVELCDREKLLTVISEVAGRERAGQTMFPVPSATVDACPQREGRLVSRSGEHGAFLGCSSYPKCRYTRDA